MSLIRQDGPMSQEAVEGLIRTLDLEAIEVNIFRGTSPDVKVQRVFGGQVAGQALVAASRTVERDDVAVHSLHAYFLRPGDPTVPILYEVDRIRDGRSFITRRVVAIQHGKAIFNLSSSFHKLEPGIEHQFPMPDVPAPETLQTFEERYAPYKEALGDLYDRPRPFDTRHVDYTPEDRTRPVAPEQRMWLRADSTLPDDPILHACVLTYASDMTLLDTVLLPHGGTSREDKFMMASLDHAMWFHQPFRADEWLLYVQDTPTASGSRGLARGLIFRHSGELVVSVVQEGLIRQQR